MKATKFTVLIVPDNSENNRSFQITRKTLRRIVFGSVLFLATLIAVAVYFGPRLVSANELQTSYNKLLSERTEVYELLRKLQNLRQMDDFLRRNLGADMKFDSEPADADTVFDETDADPAALAGVYLSYSENLPSVLPVDGFVTRDMHSVSAFTHENHYGLDIAVKTGDPIKAAASGYVIYSGWTYNMGNYIILFHGDGYFTVYGHNQLNLVEQRDYVQRGQVIAQAGNTGISSGPHLHFEVWKEGKAVDPIIFFPELRDKNVSISNNG
ncbi:MAG: M23 family metallopeptidase [Candidatus Neomarinimicrobiota bacterium]